MIWCVVHTQARQEMVALEHLCDQGFAVYVPKYKKTTRHARKITEIQAALFPRYIFVAINPETDRWRSINGTRGVSYLLMGQERPLCVAKNIIDALKQQEDLEGFVPLSGLACFVKGDKVRVMEGTFKDYTATFEKLADEQRVLVLLSFLGRETKISLPNYAVEAA